MTNTDKLISVIITIYNREKFLEECLLSLKNQTYKNFEAIMIDDGSTDNSLEIAKRYQEEDSRFKLIASEHVGFPEAKNIGLRNVSGDFIIFLDSDDSVYPQWLEILYTVSMNTRAPIVFCHYDEYFEGKNEKALEPEASWYKTNLIPITEHSYLKMNLLCEHCCSSYMWNKLIRKELYEGIVFEDQIALSDISTMYKIFHKAPYVIQVHLPLIHYRRHLESMGAETGAKGLEYYKFRKGIIKQVSSFIWNNYPQSRQAVKLMLHTEFNNMNSVLGADVFNKEIYDREFDRVLHTPTLNYENLHLPMRKTK